jgi:hypothetical protein
MSTLGKTGLFIEPHLADPTREVCVWYVHGMRRAVLYADEDRNLLRLMLEADMHVEVLKRTGRDDFTPLPLGAA